MSLPRLPFLHALVITILALIAGCGGGGGGSSQPFSGPTGLQANWDAASPSYVMLSWTAPPQAIDGYVLEERLGNASFTRVNTDGLISPQYTGGLLWVDSSAVAELTPISFRLYAVSGQAMSTYSNTATVTSQIRSPGYINVVGADAGFKVSWTNASLVADTLVLERGIAADYSGTGTTWTRIPSVSFGVTEYLDADVPESAYVSYRVTYSKGGAAASNVSSIQSTALKPPANLVVTAGVEKTHLTWTNRSATATAVVVTRANSVGTYPSFTDVAVLGPGATSYDDLQLPTGYYTYRIEARKAGSYGGAQSSAVKVATLPVTSSSLELTPSLLSMPAASMAALPFGGSWILGSFPGYGGGSVSMPSGGAWITQTFPNAHLVCQPGLMVDGSGHPHLVYSRYVTQGASEQALVHAWHDGTTWQAEEIARSVVNGAGIARLDASGNPIVLWQTSYSTPSSIRIALKASGTWLVESPALALDSISYSTLSMTLDVSGAPVVLVGGYYGSAVARRTGPSAWATENLPSEPGYSSSSGMEIVTTSDGDLHVLNYRQHYPYDSTYEVAWSRRTSGGWSQPSQIFAQAASYNAGITSVSPSGDRIVVAYPSATGSMLLVYAQGAWSTVVLGPNLSFRPFVAFDAQGRIHLLQSTSYYSSESGNIDYFQYDEQ